MMRNDSNSDEGGGCGRTTTTALKKGPWSAAEDAILIDYVQKHGEGNWNTVQKNCGLARCGKSCRLRWANHLRPNLKKGSFTPEEEMLIIQLHAQFGNKWARMAAQMPGRTDNEIKNYWNTRIKRRQRAGLPLYPTRTSSFARPPPSSPLQHSPHQLFMHPAFSNPSVPESPRTKRIRDGGLTFQFPVVSQFVHQHHPQTTMMNNMFQYSNNTTYGNYNETGMGFLTSTMALPSTQLLHNGGDGGCGLMDALLQDQEGRSVFSDQPPAVNQKGSDVDHGNDLLEDSLPRFEELSCSNGIDMKRKLSELEEANTESTAHEDMSKLIDMISNPALPPPVDWQTLTTTDSCENGGQSSAVTDDELGLELQHLASSLSPADQEWNIGSCTWNNMPGIG